MTEGPQSESIIFITSPTVNMTNACVDTAHLAEVVFTRFAPAAETPSCSSLHSLERSHQMQPTLQELNYAHLWCFLRVSSTSFIWGSSAGDSLSFLTFINIHYHVMNAHVLLWTSTLCFGKWSQAILSHCSSCLLCAQKLSHWFSSFFDVSSST